LHSLAQNHPTSQYEKGFKCLHTEGLINHLIYLVEDAAGRNLTELRDFFILLSAENSSPLG
jgi:hypothetical protein